MSAAADTPTTKSLSATTRFFLKFRKQVPAVIAALFLLLVVFVSIFQTALMPYTISEADYTSLFCKAKFLDNSANAMCSSPQDHILGTDHQGRDIYSRIIYGTRISLIASLMGVGLAAILGLPLGLLSGFIGGRFDRFVMWCVDIIFSIPGLLIAFGIVAILGDGLAKAMIAVGIILSTRYARLARGVILAEREELYVDSARTGGLSNATIIFKHMLPNVAPSLIVQTSLLFGAVILIEAQLSFIGVGIPVTTPSWGRLLTQARDTLLIHPYNAIPAGVAIGLVVLAWNVFGDGLRDSLGQDITSNQLSTVKRRIKRTKAATPIDPKLIDESAFLMQNVEVKFPLPRGGDVTILRDISLSVKPGKTLGIVGESGSGKSMSVMAGMGIVPSPGQVTDGQILLNGKDITDFSEKQMEKLRGKDIAMIFQEPIASLNPALTVGDQLVMPMQKHLGISKKAAWDKAEELLRLVRVPDPDRRMHEFPHQFSGGMAQRVGIARALSCDPKVLFADEPTTALDVTVQGMVIDLLKDLQKELGIGIVFITHDLGVIAEVADDIAVMYAGEIVESGTVEEVLYRPRHPYTKALLETLPHHGRAEDNRLAVIEGLVPSPTAWPTGCRFAPRCAFATEQCSEDKIIPLTVLEANHKSRCIRVNELEL